MDIPNLLKFDIEKQAIPTIHFEGQKKPYCVRLSVCDNPYCACGELTIGILTERNKNSSKSIGKVRVNVKTQEVHDSIALKNNSITYKWKQLFGSKQPKYKWDQLFTSKLTEDDWILLEGFYTADKRAIIEMEDFNSEYQNFYEFSAEQMDNPELKITFNEIFPEGEPFFIEKSDKTYEIQVHYCKKIDCECSDVNIVLRDDNQVISDFEYNYTTDKISDPSCQWILDEGKKEYEELPDRLAFRNSLIRLEYANKLLALHSAEVAKYSNLVKQESSTIGRNDPCVCGSGKKHKKCCMKKFN